MIQKDDVYKITLALASFSIVNKTKYDHSNFHINKELYKK